MKTGTVNTLSCRLSDVSDILTLLIPFISQIPAGEDEDGAKEEVDGDLLAEDGPGEDDRGDGVEIDVVGGNDGGELFVSTLLV